MKSPAAIFRMINFPFWSAGLLAFWPSGLLAFWPSGLLAFWPSGLLAFWPSGRLVVSEEEFSQHGSDGLRLDHVVLAGQRPVLGIWQGARQSAGPVGHPGGALASRRHQRRDLDPGPLRGRERCSPLMVL